jgi:uncharacterized repeat protein (TIGR03803 family)
MKKLILITALFITTTFLTATAQYTKLLDFDGVTNGHGPFGSLYSDGTFLYGMTAYGGAFNYGIIFKIMPDGSGYSVLHNFDWIGQNDGTGPTGSLISDGTFLYGMTSGGGTYNFGTVFKIMPNGTGYSKLIDLTGSPYGSLVYDGVFLYGINHQGGTYNFGTIFRIMPNGSGYSEIFDFGDGVNGIAGWSGTLYSDGTYLYGTAWNGGTNICNPGGCGVLFKMLPDGSGFTKLLDFEGSNGSNPFFSGLISDGVHLYGLTFYGGTYGGGTVYKIMPDGTGYVKLMDFNGGPCTGSSPVGTLAYDGTFLYAMNYGDGANGLGTLFKIMPDGTGFHKLMDFAGISNGSGPEGSVIAIGANLYGMTLSGGSNNKGTIFKYHTGNDGDPNTWYTDADGDGYGTGPAIINCIQPANTSAIDGDCNDADALVHPGATEICGNNIDDNCNGVSNEGCCAMTVNAGNDESTFFGYSGDQTVTRTAIVSGGTAPFSYSWTMNRPLKCNEITAAGDEIFSGGVCTNTVCPTTGTFLISPVCSGSATVTVRLMDTSSVCVTVTDANGCVATDCFLVMAEDARCFAGNSGNYKIKVCHHTNSTTNPWVQICVANDAVPALVAQGDYVGTCAAREALIAEDESEWSVGIFPNPAYKNVNVSFLYDKESDYEIRLLDITGRLVKNYFGTSLIGENERSLNLESFAKGVYKIIIVIDDKQEVKKLVIE